MTSLALDIAIGIWLGGVALILSVVAVVVAGDTFKKNRRYGRPWWRVT